MSNTSAATVSNCPRVLLGTKVRNGHGWETCVQHGPFAYPIAAGPLCPGRTGR